MAHIAFAVAAGIQALGALQQGRFAKAKYGIDAQFAELKGRQNALNYGDQALKVMGTQREMMGSISARATAGGVNPFTGSALTVAQWNAFKSGEEYNRGIENADMAIAGGLAQSQALKAAGDQAMKTAYVSALSSVAMGAYGFNQLAPGAGTATTAGAKMADLSAMSSMPTSFSFSTANAPSTFAFGGF